MPELWLAAEVSSEMRALAGEFPPRAIALKVNDLLLKRI